MVVFYIKKNSFWTLHVKIFEHKDWKHWQLSSNILSLSIKLRWQFIATIYIQTFCCHGIAFNYVLCPKYTSISFLIFRCIADHWELGSGQGCKPCNCDVVGSLNSTCNVYSGKCQCKGKFGGRACDQRKVILIRT